MSDAAAPTWASQEFEGIHKRIDTIINVLGALNDTMPDGATAVQLAVDDLRLALQGPITVTGPPPIWCSVCLFTAEAERPEGWADAPITIINGAALCAEHSPHGGENLALANARLDRTLQRQLHSGHARPMPVVDHEVLRYPGGDDGIDYPEND